MNKLIFLLFLGFVFAMPDQSSQPTSCYDTFTTFYHAVDNGETMKVYAFLSMSNVARDLIGDNSGLLMGHLHRASARGNKDIVKALLRAGFSPFDLDQWDTLPVTYAARKKDKEIVRLLLLEMCKQDKRKAVKTLYGLSEEVSSEFIKEIFTMECK